MRPSVFRAPPPARRTHVAESSVRTTMPTSERSMGATSLDKLSSSSSSLDKSLSKLSIRACLPSRDASVPACTPPTAHAGIQPMHAALHDRMRHAWALATRPWGESMSHIHPPYYSHMHIDRSIHTDTDAKTRVPCIWRECCGPAARSVSHARARTTPRSERAELQGQAHAHIPGHKQGRRAAPHGTNVREVPRRAARH